MRYKMIDYKKESFEQSDRFAYNSFGKKYYLDNPYYVYKVFDTKTKKEFTIIAVMSKEMSERIIRTEIIKNYKNCSNYLFVPQDDDLDLNELLEALYDYDFECAKVFSDSLKTYEMCLKFIKKKSRNLAHVPLEYQDENMLNYYVEELKGSIRYIEVEKRSKELCLKALKINPRAIIYIPIEYMTQEMWLDALNRDNKLLNKIPVEYLTIEKCIEIVLKNIYLMDYVPDKYFIEVYETVFVKSKSIRPPYTFREEELFNSNYRNNNHTSRDIWFNVEKRLLSLKNMRSLEEGKIDEVLTGNKPVIDKPKNITINLLALASNLTKIQEQINILDKLDKEEQKLLEQLESIRTKKSEAIKIMTLGFGGIINE